MSEFVDLTERRAWFVYEGARMAAYAAKAPIIPEPYELRDAAFRTQFAGVIAMMCGPDRKTSPEELHEDWMKAPTRTSGNWSAIRTRCSSRCARSRGSGSTTSRRRSCDRRRAHRDPDAFAQRRLAGGWS